jgi:hypothetical protein
MILNALVVLTVALTGDTCASIDNRTNVAVWASKHKHGIMYHRTTYTEDGRLRYANAPGPNDNAAWMALHAAERALTVGKPGHKVPVRCVKVA